MLAENEQGIADIGKGIGPQSNKPREDAGVSHEEFDELEEFIAAG